MAVLATESFSLAEGSYKLKENIFLEIGAPNLASGTLVSIVSVKYKEYPAHPSTPTTEDVTAIDPVGENISSNPTTPLTENTLEVDLDEPTELEKTQPYQQQLQTEQVTQNVDLNSNLTSAQNTPLPKPLTSNGSIPTSIEGKNDDVFSFLTQNVIKRKKTKNNLTKTTSSFVAKIIQNDNLTKILANRQNEDTYLFFNSGRTFCWVDLTNNPKDPLSKINFTKAHPICHDVNQLTRSCDHLDVIIGFSSGDIIWFDPLCNKYYRLNKQGIINSSSVTMVKWVPGSENLFMASYQDGSVVIYDKEKDDQNFSPATTNEEDGFRVARPSKNGKHNPVSYWQVSKKAVTAFAFSPDCQHVATVSIDGFLRIIDFKQETLFDTYSSYFGGFSCVCWSPDGKYILTGGQDDLVTIWAFREQRIVARCQGHQSWVTGVSFDPWRCDERNYRFGSVGEDTKLLLWDFSVNALHKPKSAGSHRRSSLASQSHVSTVLRRNLVEREIIKNTIHPCLPRSEVAILQPVMDKSIDGDPLCSLTFREDSIITTCRKGHIKIWARP
ncbi:WD40-repeat-containing domain protein [Gigaspora rosea]|uniref:WD40-repeat-containing domain protein n=1 Tax=Gigaspora rosea TaxID=44941 RepID=A0A397W1W6_9GLOM|nr:WD40-repeat-containing domain protein [Gigaspora rosea]